ncbi:MAG: TIGR04211 family SH3 domain-containing protein [Gammaproteobacteria bacterium]
MTKFQILLASLLIPVLMPASVLAETIYVSDHLVITIRSGKGTQYQIIKTAPSGTKLEVLTDTDEGYTYVRTPDGVEGWVRSQYLTKEPIAKVRLERAEARLAKLKEENQLLKTELKSLRSKSASLEEKNKSLSGSSKSLDKELAHLKQVAARPLQLDNENRKLQQANVTLEKEIQLLSQENQVLKDRSQREWFIAGALVLLGGLIIGLIIPKIRWKKSSGW